MIYLTGQFTKEYKLKRERYCLSLLGGGGGKSYLIEWYLCNTFQNTVKSVNFVFKVFHFF